MRSVLIGGLLTAALALALSSQAAAPTGTKAKSGKLRHVVLFKFKDSTSPEQVRAIEDAFRALPSKIPTVVDFEWGKDVSVENLSQGFTHCFLVTFKDAEGRKVYLPHPAHKEFVKLAGPHFDKVLVVDYFVKQ